MMPTLALALVAAMFLVPLVLAAGWDLACFRIPNRLTLAMALLFPLAALLAPVQVAWGWHVAAGFGVFAAGAGLFAMGLMGGGDVKLMAAATLWLGLPNLGAFMLLVSLSGAALTLALLGLRALPIGRGGPLPAVLHAKAGIPYGVAIATGGILLVWRLPLLGG
ncbi:prepilin peptidase [Magnetospirillum sp. UT-4]|uniref:A24 family peptidase n=1 Tax=Magnetospirillum sp. UT-4 TaxID=2681467 RepID=UPI00137C6864|nr:prepilin peptidase [Magnetospirillum sp. UT-4]CAA7615368.1 Type IV prepilin peptidase TadV/CpaA [Magnetospirillum sp. UT-4]